jgi:hypothetical protein
MRRPSSTKIGTLFRGSTLSRVEEREEPKLQLVRETSHRPGDTSLVRRIAIVCVRPPGPESLPRCLRTFIYTISPTVLHPNSEPNAFAY